MNPTSQRTTPGADKPATGPVGLIGLGLMGMALVQRLREGGFTVWGYAIDPRGTIFSLPPEARWRQEPRRLPPPAVGFS